MTLHGMKVHGIFVSTKSVFFHTIVVYFSHQSHVHLVDSHKPLLDGKAICFLLHNFTAAAAAAKLLQSCPTLCDPINGSPLGSPVPGILPARTLKWGAISFSNA